MKKSLFIRIAFVVILLVSMLSCSKQDEVYKGFVVPGGLKYPQKADSLLVQAGYNRLLVSWLAPIDPSVTKAKVFWNSGLDSLEVNLAGAADRVEVILDNLEEDTYSVTVYTYDAKGNKSVPVEGSGTVYGPSYTNSRSDREVTSATVVVDKLALVKWGAKTADLLKTEVRYKTVSGEYRTVEVPIRESQTWLEDFDNSGPVSYRSVFMPKEGADEAPAEWTTIEGSLPEEVVTLPKHTWSILPLPTDSYGSSYGTSIGALWNNNTGDIWATPFDCPKTIWFTVDLGYQVSLKTIQWHHRVPYETFAGSGIRHFQVWGSEAPAADGTWDSWTLLGDFEAFKPSGYQPDGSVGPITGDDEYHWIYENIYRFTPTEEAPDANMVVRYVRVKLLDSFDTWGKDPIGYIYVIAEMTFSGTFGSLEERNLYVN